MQIKIKQLALVNFKGIRDLSIKFGERTTISGDNATGKTTLFDAFCWALFGKDSLDRKDFNLKTLLASGEALHRVDHSVTLTLSVDGLDTTLQRVLREKWVKKRGETLPEFSGHETLFFVNGVPTSATDYQRSVAEIIPESLFKLLTSPYYFNAMKWQDKRAALLSMAGDVTDEMVAGQTAGFAELIADKKGIEQQKKEAAALRRMLGEELSLIPSRIDEQHRSMPEATDEKAIRAELEALVKQITDTEAQMQSAQKALEVASQKALEGQKKVHDLRRRLLEIDYQANEKVAKGVNIAKALKAEREHELSRCEGVVRSLKSEVASLEASISSMECKRAALAKEWEQRNAMQPTFSEDFSCPTCKRALDAADIEAKKAQLIASFNEQKQLDLAQIVADGTTKKRSIDQLKNELSVKLGQLENAQEDVRTAQRLLGEVVVPESKAVDLSQIEEHVLLAQEIEELERSGITQPSPTDHSELKKKLDGLHLMAQAKRERLVLCDRRGLALKRVHELEERERELSQLIADQEKVMDFIADFEKARIAMVEERVNGLFRLVRFKMYNQLINGGEEPTCEALIGGVPYPDANHAAQINAGIDIINAFARHYDTTAPIFIDNAEAVTRLEVTDSQLIRLVVSPTDKALRIEAEESELQTIH